MAVTSFAQEAGQPADDSASPSTGRLFEQEPYDLIVLKDEAHTEIRVMPLDLPARRVPESPNPREKLFVKRIENPIDEYILWRDIESVRLFELMVLAEALDLVRQGQFDEAYDYFDYLKHLYPSLPELAPATSEYLFEDAQAWLRKGGWHNALALLNELFALDPAYERLPAALDTVTEELFQADLNAGKFAACRRLLGALRAKFPASPAIGRGEAALAERAAALVEQAKLHFDAGRLREAQDTGRAALQIWPALPEGRTFLEDVYNKYPRIVVGVTVASSDEPGEPLGDWAARRTSRLLHRYLVEFAGTGPEGGRYVSPFGQLEQVNVGRGLLLRIRRGIRWSTGDDTLSGYDVARRLLSLAEPDPLGGPRDWGDLLRGVAVRDVYEIEADLARSHVRPEALLQVPLEPLPSQVGADGLPATIGPYSLLERTGDTARYVAQQQYFAARDAQPTEIAETYFAASKDAFAALQSGQVQILDRVNPWELERFTGQDDLIVERYALPSVHCLLANPDRPFTANRSFRRALLYGANRELIFEREIMRGAVRPGCQLISGPFPVGTALDDPLRYAYNVDIAPRPFDARVAVTLANTAVKEVGRLAKAKGQEPPEAIPNLVLAHPAHETARKTCELLVSWWQAIGIQVSLAELPVGATARADGPYDLVYAELVVQEPLVEARRILGEDGLTRSASPYMRLALRQLDAATGWKAARAKLQEIHEIAADDVAVIPLWQLTEHFVRHRSVEGIGNQPVLLYQNVEDWRGSVQLPQEGT